MAQFGKLKSKILLFIISFCCAGLISKKMPGTIGSFVATLLLLAMPKSSALVLACFLVSFLLGWLCCSLYIPKYDTNKDPGYVVIDEVCGIFLSGTILYHFGYSTKLEIIIAFALFRLFDIFKPYPIRNIENYMKMHKNTISFGIMLDDIIASLFASMVQIMFTFK